MKLKMFVLVLGPALMLAGACPAAKVPLQGPLTAPLRSDTYTYTFVAETDDATALFVNPAGLGARNQFSWLLRGVYLYDRLPELSLGFSFPGLGLGYMHQSTQPYKSNSYLLGLGAELFRQFYIGGALNWHHTDLGTDYRSPFSTDLGFLCRPSRYLSFGGVWRNINRPRFAGGRLEDRFIGGISIRPLTEWITLSADGAFDDGEKPSWKVGGSFWIVPGLELFGAYLRDYTYTESDPYEEYTLGLSFGLGSTKTLASYRTQVDADAEYRRYGFGFEGTNVHVRETLGHAERFAEMTVSGTYQDEGGHFILWGTESKNLHGALRELASIRKDDDVKGLLIKIGPMKGSFIGPVSASLDEIREAVLEVRGAGKPVVAYLSEYGSASELYLASAADRIIVPKEAVVGMIGVSLEINRMKRLFEKLGVEWDWYTAGDYKSSFHSFYTDTTTAVQAKAIQSLVEESYRLLTWRIAEGRGIDIERMHELADGRVFTPEEAVEEGLVDGIGFEREARTELGRLANKADPDKISTTPVGRRKYWTLRWKPAPTIAVVGAYGGIRSGKSKRDFLRGGRTMGSETVVKQLKAAARYPGVKAIVFRVDSGGGSALASDEILEEIRRIQVEERIPVFVSMGNIAGSGGYWISMYGAEIFANPYTITGSIGVVFYLPVLEQLYEKIGMTNEVFKVGEHADALSMRRHLTDEEREYLAKIIDGMYDFFIERVAEGREMDPERVREVAGGRVYFGTQAKELGLVDRLGGLRDAVEFAAEATGIEDDYRTAYFRAFPGFRFHMLMDESVSGFGGRLLRELRRDDEDGLFETITIF